MSYPVTPAVTFPTKPHWPVYEAPPMWYIQKGERFGGRKIEAAA